MGYAIGIAAEMTPAYSEFASLALEDIIWREIDPVTWSYIDQYWADTPYFPDPVVHENIMYSGHLGQLIALYEAISGDTKFTDQGWDFIWTWENSTQQVMHYTAPQLMKAMTDQMDSTVGDPKDSGCVACEPGWCYIVCNEHPHNAFNLYDAFHGSNYTHSDYKWLDFLKREGRENIPIYDRTRYLHMMMDKKLGLWAPMASPGNDAWGIPWTAAWSPDRDFICEGYISMRDRASWSPGDLGGEHMDVDLSGTCMQFNTYIATSFFPTAEHLCSTTERTKTNSAYEYFEYNCGTLNTTAFVDTFEDTRYYYAVEDPQYTIWSTANTLTAMVTMHNESFFGSYHQPLFFRTMGQPRLLHVDYTKVAVVTAIYSEQTLHFVLKLYSMSMAPFDCPIECYAPNFGSLVCTGETITDYTYSNTTSILTFHATLDGKYSLNCYVKAF
ncbi:Linalool dehydratase/isomerase [Pelomyxa schiedti]|nr:Linalool dehydratase/isomerase [Pelomyxa schiedti]